MASKDILERFVSEVWYGTPSLKEKLQSLPKETSCQFDKFVVITDYCSPNDFMVMISSNSQKKDMVFFVPNENGEPRIFANLCTKEEAHAHLDFLISHLAEILNALKPGKNYEFV